MLSSVTKNARAMVLIQAIAIVVQTLGRSCFVMTVLWCYGRQYILTWP